MTAEIKSIDDFLKAVGFREDDILTLTIKTPEKKIRGIYPKSFDKFCWHINKCQKEENYYYSHATHTGLFNAAIKGNFCEDKYIDVVCMTFDIDYGKHHQKGSDYKDLDEALTVLKKMPTPTVVIHSGGGNRPMSYIF